MDYPVAWNGGTLSTVGNLVFQGTADGHAVAYSADKGQKLWEAPVNSGAMAGPITYEVGGRAVRDLHGRLGWHLSAHHRPAVADSQGAVRGAGGDVQARRPCRVAALAVFCIDARGYLPTHNSEFSQSPPGEGDHDLRFCRDKQLMNDRHGLRAAGCDGALLLQTFVRDNGELTIELALPLYAAARRWGALRLGFSEQVATR